MKKLNFTFLLIVLMSMVGAKALAQDEEFDDYGNCGGGLTYTFKESTGVLTISKTGKGTGKMSDWKNANKVPWYSYKNEVTKVIMEEGVTTIGDYAFDGCESLTSVTIPYGVTSIGTDAFSKCSGLISITIPYGVTTIGYYSFYRCSSLTIIEIPNSVTSIESSAFYGTTWYDNQPDGLVYAGKIAYRYKGTMPENTNITIKEGTLGIADNAFSGCSGLTSVTIPNSVTSIGYHAFYGCSGLTSITIPDNVTSIENEAFRGCSSLTSLTILNGITSIGGYIFSDCTSLTSVTIPNSVKIIGDGVFAGCSNLTSIDIPNSVTSIGYSAFHGCRSLTSITIPNYVTSIGDQAFRDCSSLTSIDIPNRVTSIGDWAFMDCTGLTSVTIPNSVTSINTNAFSGCRGLILITFHCKNIIGDGFSNLPLIKEIIFGNEVTTIGKEAFYRSGLTSIDIPNSVTSIGESSFAGCNNLTSIDIPNSVITIGKYAFSGCYSLNSVTIPNSVTTIGESSFANCNMTSIDIPNSVTSIGESAFHACRSLTSVTIPNSVTNIGYAAFNECSSLTSVTVDIETPSPISDNAFSNRKAATLYVPYGCKTTYKATNYWKEFKEIVETPNYDPIKIGSTGMATYCSKKAMDFTGIKGLKAYIATGYDYDSGNILLTRIYKVPAGTGIMLMGTAGTYEIPHVETNYTYASMLKGVTTSTHLDQTSDGYTNYILMNGADGVLFYKVSESGGSLAANRAYLQVPIIDAEARTLDFTFDDENTTGVQRLKNGMTEESKSIYDLNGRRVDNPQKGIYIVNGKKVVLK